MLEEISGRHLFHRESGGVASLPVISIYQRCEEDDMDVAHLTTATAIGNKEVLRGRASKPEKTPKKVVRKAQPPEIDKTQLKAALDKIIRNTRFQYILKDELDYFVVRIIDKDTDKVIREIPSKELQKVHEGIDQALGLLFDEFI
jgi:flagellar protein FlaG